MVNIKFLTPSVPISNGNSILKEVKNKQKQQNAFFTDLNQAFFGIPKQFEIAYERKYKYIPVCFFSKAVIHEVKVNFTERQKVLGFVFNRYTAIMTMVAVVSIAYFKMADYCPTQCVDQTEYIKSLEKRFTEDAEILKNNCSEKITKLIEDNQLFIEKNLHLKSELGNCGIDFFSSTVTHLVAAVTVFATMPYLVRSFDMIFGKD